MKQIAEIEFQFPLLLNFAKPHIPSRYNELAFYTLIATRLFYVSYWKDHLIPPLEVQLTKLWEYAFLHFKSHIKINPK